jgi:hypothetical protein
MPRRICLQTRPSRICWPAVLALSGEVLRWLEPCAEGVGAASFFFNKLEGWSLDLEVNGVQKLAASASFPAVSLFILPAAMVVDGRCVAAAGGGSRWLWSAEACCFSSSSSTVHGDPWKLLVCSSTYSTSDVRPLLKPAVAAVHVGILASGEVPATVLGNGKLGFLLDGGEREGLDCNLLSFSRVLSAFAKDLCVISCFYGVLCKTLVHPLLGI